jgi:phosphotransferase system HPr (HPr) family protein
MTVDFLRRSVTITNPQGLHMRPLQALVEVAGRFQSAVYLRKEGSDEKVNGKSLLNLLTMGAEQGTVVHLEVSGPDCHEALTALTEVLERTYTDE